MTARRPVEANNQTSITPPIFYCTVEERTRLSTGGYTDGMQEDVARYTVLGRCTEVKT